MPGESHGNQQSFVKLLKPEYCSDESDYLLKKARSQFPSDSKLFLEVFES